METENKEIIVDIAPPAVEEIDIGADAPAQLPVSTKEKEKPVADTVVNDGVEQLRRELEAKKREADEIRRQKAEAERSLVQKETEVRNYAHQAADNQHTAFVNAIASFERDGEMLEKEYAAKLEQGDYHAAAKIQRGMAQIESKLATLYQGKEALEERIQYERSRPEPQYQQQPQQQVHYDPIEAQLQALSPQSQAWVRKNIHVMHDPKLKNSMTAAHYRALAENITVDTPQYFQFIENEMGMGQQNAPAQPKQRNVVTAAPVARGGSVPAMNQNQTRVTLTPEMRAYAEEVLGMTDEEYAEAMVHYAKKGQLRI
jgi:hypothetical protein